MQISRSGFWISTCPFGAVKCLSLVCPFEVKLYITLSIRMDDFFSPTCLVSRTLLTFFVLSFRAILCGRVLVPLTE